MKRYLSQLLSLFIATLFVVIASPLRVLAISQADFDAIYGDYSYYEDTADCSSISSNAAANKLKSGAKVYILGDSITVRSASTYQQQLSAKGITPTISAVSGRSWKTAGNPGQGATGTQGAGKDAFALDMKTAKDKSITYDGFIVALGTNGFIGNNPIDEVIKSIRASNASAPIWWINTALDAPGNKDVIGFNAELEKGAASTSNPFGVISWSHVVDPSGDGTHDPQVLLDDKIHPSIPKGVTQLVNTVAGQITSDTPSSDSSSAASCSCGGSSDNLTGSNHQEQAFNFFLSNGYSPEQAAGVIGNMMVESGVEPLIEQGKTAQNSRSLEDFLASGESRKEPGEIGYGLVQWTGYGQLDAMVAWTKSNGKDPHTLAGQLAYIQYQLTNTKKSIGAHLKSASTIDAAAVVWNVEYELSGDSKNPGSPAWQKRIAFAKDVFAKYGSNNGGSGGINSSVACGASGQIVGDFSLPVDKKWYTQHKAWFTNPHHDYPAADIPVPIGTPVYSMTSGKVITGPAGGDCGLGLSIRASGNVVFTYCHGSDGGSIEGAKVGDTVKPGQLIMHSASTGHSTGPHLHVAIKVNGTNHCPQSLFVGIAEGPTIPDVASLPTSGCTE